MTSPSTPPIGAHATGRKRQPSKLDRATRAVFKTNTGMNPGSRAPLDEWYPLEWSLAKQQARAALGAAGIKS